VLLLLLSPLVSLAQRFLSSMEPYQCACVNNAAASNWLSARLQLLAAVLLSAVAALAAVVAAVTAADNSTAASGGVTTVVSHSLDSLALGPLSPWDVGSNGSSSSGSNGSSWTGGTFRIDLLGLALAYCLPIVNLLNGLLTSSAETEQDMVAVERISGLLDSLGAPEQQHRQQQQRQRRRPLPGSNAEQQQLLAPLLTQQQGGDGGQEDSWGGDRAGSRLQQPPPPAAVAAAAAAGVPAVELLDVVMRYRPGLPPALRGVSFSVPVGHKLGVCGRTGERGWWGGSYMW